MRSSYLLVIATAVSSALLAIAACTDDPAASVGDAGSVSDATSSGDSSIDASQDVNAPKEGGVIGPVGLVYAGRYNNIDIRVVQALFDSEGKILGYDAGPQENIAAGTAMVDGVFSDDFASASRWTNGTVLGNMYDDGGPKSLLANEGQHLGIALRGTTVPASGTVSYTLAAASKPTLRGAQIPEGTVTSGALTAEFAGETGTRVGFTLNVTMAEGEFVLNGNGGSTSVGDAGGTFNALDAGFRFTAPNMTVSTAAGTCAPDAGTCPTTGASRLVFAGPNAERILIAYSFGQRHGVVVFKKP